MASHQDMKESGKADGLPDSSHKNGTKKKHVQLQIMENNNSEDWHGTRLSLLNHIHVDYRNIERTLNEGPSFSTAPHQTLANHTIENEHERNIDANLDCLERVNGEVSNHGSFPSRHLNGTGFLLMNPNNTDRLNHQLYINGTHSCTDTSTSEHTDSKVNGETLGSNSDLPAVNLYETGIHNCTTSPNALPCQIDENQFHNQQQSVKTLHSNVVSEPNINTLEHSVEDHRQVFQNGYDRAEETIDYRLSDMFQNNLDPSDVTSQENHGFCGFSCNNVKESVLNVVSGEIPKDSAENQIQNTENCVEVELNNFLLENFSEQVNNVDCDEEVCRQEQAEDADSDLDAGNQGQSSSSSSSSSSSDIVDDMIMNVELGNRLQLSSSAALPTCLPGENHSEDSDEGLEVDVCDDVSEREEESNNEDVENIPMDDGDDDGCLDVWDMPQMASTEESQEGQVNNNADTFFDFLPENYTLNERDNLCRNDTDLRELDRYHSGASFTGDISNYPENKDDYEALKHQPVSNGLAMNTNSLDVLSVPQDFSHISCNGGSMNYFQGAMPQSSQKHSMSEAEHVRIFEQTNSYKTDDDDSIGDSSNVSDTEFGFNHQCENLNTKIGGYKDSKNTGKTEIFSSALHGNDRELPSTDDHSQVSNTYGLSVSVSCRDQLPDNFRNCRHFEDAIMSVNNESRSASSNQRQFFSLTTGGSLHSPSNFPHCPQSKEQEDERHSEKRLLLQEVKDQMALQLRRLDDRQHEELRFEEVLQADFEVEEQDDLDLDYEDDDLRPSNYIGIDPIQDDTIGSEEESSDIIESVTCLSVSDVGLSEIDGACGCSNESSHETLAMANEEAHCRNRNCRTWHNLINEDEDVIGKDVFASISDDQQREVYSRKNDQQPFIIWRQSLLRGENEPNAYDPLSELEGYVIDRNKEFVVRRKHQMNPPNDIVERRCLTETGEFNHNQNNNEEDIDSPESLVELEENILRDRLLALKPDDVDSSLWNGLHPSNVLGSSEEMSDICQLDTASGSIASNVITSVPSAVTEHISETVTDGNNSCNNSKFVGTDDNKQNRNIIQVCKQRSKTVEQLPPNSAFIWTPRKAQSRPEYHKGTHQFLHLAVKNALIALGYNPNLNEERGFAQHIKESCSTVSKLLVSSRKHYGLPEDIKAALSKHSSNEVFCRFFSFYPPRKVNLYKWLKEWISLGVVPIASFNPQVGVASESTVPKEWRHQMIYGVDEEQAYLCTPNVRLSYQNLMNQLSSDSILLVAREDVVNRWDRWSRLGELKHPPDNDSRWIQMNVLGQVVNMMREQSAPKPHEDYSRRYYYKPLKQRRTTHIRIPACYESGITLCAKIEDKKSCDVIQSAPELPLLE